MGTLVVTATETRAYQSSEFIREPDIVLNERGADNFDFIASTGFMSLETFKSHEALLTASKQDSIIGRSQDCSAFGICPCSAPWRLSMHEELNLSTKPA